MKVLGDYSAAIGFNRETCDTALDSCIEPISALLGITI